MAELLHIPAVLLSVPAVNRRRERRTLLPTAIGEKVLVTDISPRGAQVIAPAPIPVGREVRLKLPWMEPLDATVVWVSNRIAGCEFTEPLHPAALRVLLAASAADQADWQLTV